jgi:hypothetical protein
VKLMSCGVAFEPRTRPMLAGLPTRSFEAAGGTPQEHAARCELQDGIVAVPAADGALQVSKRSRQETA